MFSASLDWLAQESEITLECRCAIPSLIAPEAQSSQSQKPCCRYDTYRLLYGNGDSKKTTEDNRVTAQNVIEWTVCLVSSCTSKTAFPGL